MVERGKEGYAHARRQVMQLHRLLFYIAAFFALAEVHAEDDEAAAKAIRMKTSRQLREILSELNVDAPASLSKDELRVLALNENAIQRWEELHPEKKRSKPAGGGPDFDAAQMPEGMDPAAWAKLMGQMRGDFSGETDPERRRILQKLKAKGLSFGGGSDMDTEQLRNLEAAMGGMSGNFRTPGEGSKQEL